MSRLDELDAQLKRDIDGMSPEDKLLLERTLEAEHVLATVLQCFHFPGHGLLTTVISLLSRCTTCMGMADEEALELVKKHYADLREYRSAQREQQS